MPDVKCLIYGYGNPGRQDDGLGIELATMVENNPQLKHHVDVDYNYQLNIEDALTISEYDKVIFIDAAFNIDKPFVFYTIQPADTITFTTHYLSAESIVALCNDLYKKQPESYMLAIQGYNWELGLPMSEQANSNLQLAYNFISEVILNRFSCCITG
ncbi:MAG TPA: hydrogenase maturation protease [Spirochaetota bacterium]|jgi:hydrogenase maturation protease|nr:hydrogenase maturation protease [Spirochaetota bacterium]HOM87596.1 hydrogenase maturation protease [Spirochaetota bacterium]HOR92849.1 hydrogenase maturation protease [Spirochaetota bacterium]HOT19078.1 hydrogenase maturation protease [Spirochaetota bacterium]HPD04315.1 hydrogenase maturation protease [Spirochaetota bacterium]